MARMARFMIGFVSAYGLSTLMGIALAAYPTVQITNMTGSQISVSRNDCGLPTAITMVSSTAGICQGGPFLSPFTITAPLQGPLCNFQR